MADEAESTRRLVGHLTLVPMKVDLQGASLDARQLERIEKATEQARRMADLLEFAKQGEFRESHE